MNTTTGFDSSAKAFFQNILSQLDSIETTGRFYLPMGEAHQSLIDTHRETVS